MPARCDPSCGGMGAEKGEREAAEYGRISGIGARAGVNADADILQNPIKKAIKNIEIQYENNNLY